MEGKTPLPGREIRAGGKDYTISIEEEDLSRLYPGMTRFTLSLVSGGKTVAVFRTNSYEYSPSMRLEAGQVARRKAVEWEEALRKDPERFLASLEGPRASRSGGEGPDVLVIQGSPRPDGNCSVLAGWAAEEATASRVKVRVVYLDDLSLRPCIGCYQCYNTGSCTFDDDMADLIGSLRSARLLVVCSPVYTNTVPGALKIFIDRCQAFHAEKNLFREAGEKRGLLLAVAGRTGRENFECVRKVVLSFMRNLGIEVSGQVLLDGMDRARDVRTLPGLREEVGDLVREALRG